MGVFPTQVKIDVVGFEGRIIDKMEESLLNSKLKSVAVEVNEQTIDYVVNALKDYGFNLLNQPENLNFETINLIFNRSN